MKKIVIIGNGGTGKSTLAEHLGKKLNIKVTHLDKLAWKQGFKLVPFEEFQSKLREILKKDSFIVDGWSHHSTIKERFKAADTIIFLDYPIWYCYLSRQEDRFSMLLNKTLIILITLRYFR